MRLSLRFIIPLLLAIAAFAYAVVPLVDKLTLRWFMRDLDSRSSLISNTVQESLQDLIGIGKRRPSPAVVHPDHAGRTDLCHGVLRVVAGPAGGDRDAAGGDPLRRAAALRGSVGAPADERAWPVARFRQTAGSRGRSGGAARPRARHELRRAPQRGNPEVPLLLLPRPGRHRLAHHGRHRPTELARLGPGSARAVARRGSAPSVGQTRPARAGAHRPRSARADPRYRSRASGARRRPGRLELGIATRHSAWRAARARSDRRIQPRAVHPRPSERRDRRAAARERTGHRAGADHACLLRDLDRARQRLGRPGRRGRARPGRACRGSIPRISCAVCG